MLNSECCIKPLSKIQIIAEIGLNHEGNIEVARSLVDEAANAGVQMIKFQYRNLENTYAHSTNALQIGDEIVKREIESNYLSPSQITELADYAKTLNIRPGASFFSHYDILDFDYTFDFYKIPSVEMTNSALVESCLLTGRDVYISTGCSTEAQILQLVDNYSKYPNWIPLHCISNYPVAARNAQIGYIKRLASLCGRKVGYSSHDENWEMALVAASIGASVIERHITHDTSALGLDHSSSSTPDEFKKLAYLLGELPLSLTGETEPRKPNQGELLNIQNLGRSLYAIENIKSGTRISSSMFKSLSPQVGITIDQFQSLPNLTLVKDILANTALTEEHLCDSVLTHDPYDLQLANTYGLALPIRLHDQSDILNRFPLNCFEYHLSYGEVLSGDLKYHPIDPSKKYSIHLPDYISSTRIIDPFSTLEDVRKLSISLIDRVTEFAKRLQDITGNDVPLVGSFSQVNSTKRVFYENIASLIQTYLALEIQIFPQWLPPTAWYFGGSVSLDVFNKTEDVDMLCDNGIRICFDICHYLMGLHASAVSEADFRRLLSIAGHLHIADTIGVDGEGIQLGQGDELNQLFIKQALTSNVPCKVLEVWQGHLNGFKGFSESLTSASRMISR